MAETVPPPIPPPIPPPVPPPVLPATPRVVPPPLPPSELRLDREHPWPGLISFTEADHAFFFGREREVAELARVIRQKTVTVFFGKSGLGKSSILRAGVSPLLRESEFIPVYIRLNHDEAAPPLEDQVEIAIEGVLETEKIDAAKPIRSETLWEYFHKKENDWWDVENRLVKPVLIFDQFEELLTLGQSTPERAVRSAAFLTELEDLVENRPPAALQERFEAERGLARSYDLGRTDYRVVLTLREDFLPDLEGLRERLRAIMFNRVRLLPMSGEQAMDVVLKPGGHLVEEDVAVRIVDFVSSSERSRLQTGVTRAQLAKRSVEPALLSVVLQELNNRRFRLGQEKITAELVGQTNPTEIFHDFYLRGLQGMDGQVRGFIEDCLLTSSGARNRIAEEDALTKQGISSGVISTLIDRRIIQRETSGNTKWLELTHDTLADVVRSDRAEHHQQRELELAKTSEKEAKARLRRVQKLAAAFGVVLVILGAALWGLTERVKSQANDTVGAIRKELDMPAQGAPDRLQGAIKRLSRDTRQFFFLPRLKLAYGQALSYAAQVLYFNGRITDGSEYSARAVKLLDGFGSNPAAMIPRATAYYAHGRGELEKGQLSTAESDFQSARTLAEKAPKLMADAEQNNIHILAELGLAQVQSARDLRSDAEETFNKVLAETKSSSQNGSLAAAIYEVLALRGLGVIRERSGQVNDSGVGPRFDAVDFLEKADMKVSALVDNHPDDVVLRATQADTAYWRIFFLIGSGRPNASYGPVATRLRDALTKGESLSNLDQQNGSWKLLLAQNYRLQGMMFQSQGETIHALEAFKKMWDLAADIQRSEPAWFVNNYYLTIAESYMAQCISTLSTSQDLETFQSGLTALTHGHEGRAFSKATINFGRRVVDISNDKAADQESRNQRSAKAIAEYRVNTDRQVQTQLNELLRGAPGNAEYERTKILITIWIGNDEAYGGQSSSAIRTYQEALQALGAIPERVKALPDFQDLQASINESLAATALKVGDEANKRLALQCRSRALEIRTSLATVQASVNNIAQCASASIFLGDVHLAGGNREQAKQFYESAGEMYETALAAAHTGVTERPVGNSIRRRMQLLSNKARALSYIASKWREVRDFEATSAALRTAVEAAHEVFQHDPLDTDSISLLRAISEGAQGNWKKFCEDNLNDSQLTEADRKDLQAVCDLVSDKAFMPSLDPVKATPAASENWHIFPLMPGSWRNLHSEELSAEVQYLTSSQITPPVQPHDIARIRTLALPCYEDATLYEVELRGDHSPPKFLSYVRTSNKTAPLQDFSSIDADEARAISADPQKHIDGVRLNGTEIPMEIFNSKHHPILENEVSATAYLRFFCTELQGEEGTFHIVDNEGDLHWKPEANWKSDVPKDIREEIQRRIHPFEIEPTPTGWEAKVTIAYADAVFYALLQVHPDGTVTMDQDEPLRGDLPISNEAFVEGFRVVDASKADLLSTTANWSIKTKRWSQAINALAGLSWRQLELRDFAAALATSEKGLKLVPGNLLLETNRAHALLFLGRENEAEEIYGKYLGQKIGAQTWEKVILEDFAKLEKDGITNPQFARIRQIFGNR